LWDGLWDPKKISKIEIKVILDDCNFNNIKKFVNITLLLALQQTMHVFFLQDWLLGIIISMVGRLQNDGVVSTMLKHWWEKVRGQSPHHWESHNKSYSKLHHTSVHLHFVTSFIEKLFFAPWLQKQNKKESCIETLNVYLPHFFHYIRESFLKCNTETSTFSLFLLFHQEQLSNLLSSLSLFFLIVVFLLFGAVMVHFQLGISFDHHVSC
jgi:hypothetical protein